MKQSMWTKSRMATVDDKPNRVSGMIQNAHTDTHAREIRCDENLFSFDILELFTLPGSYDFSAFSATTTKPPTNSLQRR